MNNLPRTIALTLLACQLAAQSPTKPTGADWPGFRGLHHDGVALDGAPPTTWSDTDNLRWQVELPGPGSSSPVVVGDRVYVASYTGYGNHLDDGGDKAKLVHHLSCLSRADGTQIWSTAVPGPLQNDARQMQLTEHGFASPTPVVEGGRIFAYFGRAGVVAFDLDGEVVWQTDLGEPDPHAPAATNQVERGGQVLSLKWGSAASPVLHDGMVLVNCSEESHSIRALNQTNGELMWKLESANLEGSACPPAVFGEGDGAVAIIVLGGAIWGLNPKTGERLWEIETASRGGMSSMPVAANGVAYVFGGDTGYALHYAPHVADAAAAPPKDGAGDTARDPRVVWTSKSVAIPSPCLYEGKVLAVNSTGKALTLDMASGDVLHDARLDGRTGGVYASPVIAGGHCYIVSRKKGVFVYSTDGTFELVAHNELDDDSQWNASPAIAGNEMFLRSDKCLYCIAAQ